MVLDPLDTFPLLPGKLDTGLGLLFEFFRRCTDHITNELLPNLAVFVQCLGILGQLKWPLAGNLVLQGPPLLHHVLVVYGF